ncbi:MAG: hypothetical protein EOP06_27475 [Proteobacteria bacterium]|nr:MAG: hypothetical protein EOP06_27475 [Pseudomonadota bacterium]
MKKLFVLIAAITFACAGCSQQTSGSAQPGESPAATLSLECFDIQDDGGIQDRGVTKADLAPNMAVITSIEFGCVPNGVGVYITFAATSSEIAYGFTSDALTRDYTLTVDPTSQTFSTMWIQVVSKEDLAKSGYLTIDFWVEAVPATGSQPYDQRSVVLAYRQ